MMKTLLKIMLLFVVIFSGMLAIVQNAEGGDMYLNTIQYNTNSLQADWEDWRSKYVTTRDAGAAPRMRVLHGINSSTTVSEGQAYGMLFATVFDEQTLFDGFYLYARDYFNDHGLMNWQIQGTSVSGFGAATDADVDMAMALLLACDKVQTGEWSASQHGLDYCDEARTMIQAIWDYEVDHPNNGPLAGLNNNQGYELIPGDYWNLSQDYPNGITNLSYFSPAYFRVFADFTNNDEWYQVIDRGYDIASLAANNSCAGFVSNWNNYAGAPQTVPWHGYTSEYWGWDAARFAWRVGLDAYWFNDSAAQDAIAPIGSFFASVGVDNIRAEYRLNGTKVNSYRNVFFTANAAVSIWATSSLRATSCGDATGTILSNAQQAYNAVVQNKDHTYYADSWRLLSLVLMSGQLELPFDNSASPTSTEEPTPIVTDEPTPIVTEEATPIVTEEPTPIAPVIQPITMQNNVAGDTTSVEVIANSTASILTFSANGLPAGMSINQSIGIISGTLSEQSAGDYTVTISVIDNIGQTAEETFQWMVTAPEPPQDVPDVPVETGDIRAELWGATDSNNQAQFRLRLTNNSSTPQSNLSWRLYFTVDANRTASNYRLDKYWDSSNSVTVSTPIQHTNDIYYFELDYSGSLAPNADWVFQGSIHLANWQDMNTNNDWWKQGGFSNGYQTTQTIPVYVNNMLVSGTEPQDGVVISTPVPNPTIVPNPTTIPNPTTMPLPAAPTIAPIANQTSTVGASVSLPIVASTSTSQALSYSATGLPSGLSINAQTGVISGTISGNAQQYSVSVAVRDVNNQTSSSAFAWTVNAPQNNNDNGNDTPSNPPSNALQVELLGSTDSNNQAQFRVRVRNTGASSQSGMSWRLYFTVDEGYSASDYRLDSYWNSLGNATVSAPTQASGNVYYFTVSINSAIPANGEWIFQGSIHLANWQNLNTNNDWWKQGGFSSSYQATISIPVYQNGSLVVGSQPN